MFKNSFISKRENKYLLLFTLLALSILLGNFVCLSIQAINREVERAKVKKAAQANGKDDVSGFTATDCFPSFESQAFGESRFINFLFLPLSLLILRSRKTKCFSISTLLIFLSFFHFFFWFERSQERRIFLESLSVPEPSIGFDNILLNSNVFDILLFLAISILFLWQMMILIRSEYHFLFHKRSLP